MTEIPANRITTNRIVEIEGPFLFFPLSACVFAFFPIRFPTIVFHGSRTFIRPSTGVGRGFPRCSPHTTGRCQLVRHGPQAGHARLWDVALYCFCVFLMVLMYAWSFLFNRVWLRFAAHAFLGDQQDCCADYQDSADDVEDCGTDTTGAWQEGTFFVHDCCFQCIIYAKAYFIS